MQDDRTLNFHDQRQNPEAHLEYIQNNRFPVALLLDGLSDARNLGAMFRLADAGRLEAIYAYRMEALERHRRMSRLSRNTQKLTPFYHLENLEEVKALKEKFDLVALEITKKSIPYTAFQIKRPTILIVGNEQIGVSEDLLSIADAAIHIPMYGLNFSMNVSVSTGIAVYKLLEQLYVTQSGLP